MSTACLQPSRNLMLFRYCLSSTERRTGLRKIGMKKTSPMRLLEWTGMDAEISDIWNFRRRAKINLKTHTNTRLAELDEKQKVLQERKELEILRKQVEEREAVVDELEKSLSGPSLSMPKRGKEGSKKPRVAAGFQVPLPSSTPAGDSDTEIKLGHGEKE